VHSLTCQNCGSTFERKLKLRFCSNACVGEAKSKGLVGAKKRRGQSLICEICSTPFYRKPYHIKKGRSRFCSEECRLKAHEQKLVDRTQPRPKKMRGTTIKCLFCDTQIYRKKSMIDRNIGKTCGDTKCISAYGRSLWGLPPFDPDAFRLPRPKRRNRGSANFTAAQRQEWLGTYCAWCGSTKNLTLDHITPVCAGGTATRENAQTLCGRCNNIKAATVDRQLARQQFLSGG
jgi:hypothetical protein